MPIKINFKNTSFHISINSLRLYLLNYLSLECLLIFLSNLYILQWLEKSFKFMVFRLLKNAFSSQKIKSRQFYSCLSPFVKLSRRRLSSLPRLRDMTYFPQAAFFHRKRRNEKSDDMQHYIIYILCELHFFQMWWLYSFVNVICTIQYGGNFIISSLKPWPLGTKFTSGDNRYFDQGLLFIGRFKAGSVPEMRNKEELSPFVYKLA